MKKILVLGGSGMLGHKAYQILSQDFDTYVTFRHFDKKLSQANIFDENKVFDNIDAIDIESVKTAIRDLKPDFIINCIGIIKQLKKAKNPIISIYINSLFPHLLAEYCDRKNCKLIHISTDCVFSGKKGNYAEEDLSDAEDLYGKTKFLGEINYGNHLTLRTSLIGRDLSDNVALVDWFLSQEDKTVNGYVNAVFNGLTTITLCNEIKRIIKKFPKLSGLLHTTSKKITKFELLKLIRDIYQLNIRIKPYPSFYCDRSLNSDKYRKKTNFIPPSWKEMIEEMFKDPSNYNKWRRNSVY